MNFSSSIQEETEGTRALCDYLRSRALWKIGEWLVIRDFYRIDLYISRFDEKKKNYFTFYLHFVHSVERHLIKCKTVLYLLNVLNCIDWVFHQFYIISAFSLWSIFYLSLAVIMLCVCVFVLLLKIFKMLFFNYRI